MLHAFAFLPRFIMRRVFSYNSTIKEFSFENLISHFKLDELQALVPPSLKSIKKSIRLFVFFLLNLYEYCAFFADPKNKFSTIYRFINNAISIYR